MSVLHFTSKEYFLSVTDTSCIRIKGELEISPQKTVTHFNIYVNSDSILGLLDSELVINEDESKDYIDKVKSLVDEGHSSGFIKLYEDFFAVDIFISASAYSDLRSRIIFPAPSCLISFSVNDGFMDRLRSGRICSAYSVSLTLKY